jgi:hypothetical protein
MVSVRRLLEGKEALPDTYDLHYDRSETDTGARPVGHLGTAGDPFRLHGMQRVRPIRRAERDRALQDVRGTHSPDGVTATRLSI